MHFNLTMVSQWFVFHSIQHGTSSSNLPYQPNASHLTVHSSCCAAVLFLHIQTIFALFLRNILPLVSCLFIYKMQNGLAVLLCFALHSTNSTGLSRILLWDIIFYLGWREFCCICGKYCFIYINNITGKETVGRGERSTIETRGWRLVN